MKYDSIVVGGGIAGLTAAAYLAKAGQKVVLFEKQEKVGGLVQTFERNGVYFDSGLRSIENSGIVFPMLRDLGIKVDFTRSIVSIGIADKVMKIETDESLREYESFLSAHYPENAQDVKAIVKEIKKIMGYMEVLYGIDNPAFLNMTDDKKYLMKVILPWMFKFLFTIRSISKLKEPVEEYLKRFTKNQSLIDIIAQHFFQKTPTSFALSYFSLYLDYYYPKGGTATFIHAIENYCVEHGAEIKVSTSIESLHPEEKYVIDNNGNRFEYDNLVWAGDMKQLYNVIPVEKLANQKLINTVTETRKKLEHLKGGDSVFTVYLTVDEGREYFSKICTGHFFYTSDKTGLSTVIKSDTELFVNENTVDKAELKKQIIEYLNEYCRLNTFEISIPVLRDPDMAPEGKSGLIVSLLYDYRLAKRIEEYGWSEEIRLFMEKSFIDILDESTFPGIKNKISGCFSSSPLTIEKRTRNTEGGITGWAFTNPFMPSESRMLKVAAAVDTPLPSIFQAGQWVYSPSGFPISILTGKLAADKALKNGNF